MGSLLEDILFVETRNNTPRSSARGLIGIEREFRSAPLVYPRFAPDFLPELLLQPFRSRAASRRAFLHPRPLLSHTFRAVAHCRAGGVRPSCAPHAGLMHARCASIEEPGHLHAPLFICAPSRATSNASFPHAVLRRRRRGSHDPEREAPACGRSISQRKRAGGDRAQGSAQGEIPGRRRARAGEKCVE